MTDSLDPLGKRALYWLPVDERSLEGDGRPQGTDPGVRRARPAGKHALFSGATPAGEGVEATSTADGPLPSRGIVTVVCSSCGSVSRVGVLELLMLQVPFGAWLPRRVFDRWMTCPACRRRTWTSVTLSRG